MMRDGSLWQTQGWTRLRLGLLLDWHARVRIEGIERQIQTDAFQSEHTMWKHDRVLPGVADQPIAVRALAPAIVEHIFSKGRQPAIIYQLGVAITILALGGGDFVYQRRVIVAGFAGGRGDRHRSPTRPGK